MNKTVLVIVTILGGIGLFVGGLFVGQANTQAIQPGWMMGNFEGQYGTRMMDGAGMMGIWGRRVGPGMMNGGMMGMMMNGADMIGYEMMGSYGGLTNADPLSIEEAEAAVNDYLTTLNDDSLYLGEIMIFDNHAYAQVLDESTAFGAFEVLVDPVTGNVYPEPGPNMMWNNEYGMMSGFGNDTTGMMGGGMMNRQFGFGMMGGHMMGNFGYTPDSEISVTADEAVEIAQEYLDAFLSGKTADDTADSFPGYYTLHVLEDGEIVGMLSVNAASGQVFLHHWHGDFVEMADTHHE